MDNSDSERLQAYIPKNPWCALETTSCDKDRSTVGDTSGCHRNIIFWWQKKVKKTTRWPNDVQKHRKENVIQTSWVPTSPLQLKIQSWQDCADMRDLLSRYWLWKPPDFWGTHCLEHSTIYLMFNVNHASAQRQSGADRQTATSIWLIISVKSNFTVWSHWWNNCNQHPVLCCNFFQFFK